eukprot:gene44331-54211_t
MESPDDSNQVPVVPTYQPLAPESVALPDGWHCYFDDAQQAYYYYNEVDNTSQWHHPSSNEEDPYMLYENNYVEEGSEVAQRVTDLLESKQQDDGDVSTFTPYTYDNYDTNDTNYGLSSEYYVNERVNLNARPNKNNAEEKLVRNKDYLALARAYKF